MKKMSLLSNKNLLVALALVFSAAILASCKKDKTPTHTPAAGLMAFNLAPDLNSVGVDIDANLFTKTPLAYTNYTGSYLGVYAGTRTVKSYVFQSGSVLYSSPENFQDSAYYSLFVLGANDEYRNVMVQDKFNSLPTGTGKAFLRYINAIPDSSKLNVEIMTSDNTEVSNKDESFGAISSFQGVDPGDLTVRINNMTTQVDTSRTFPVAANGIYTILLVGLSNPANTDQKVDIKYIQNGTLTP